MFHVRLLSLRNRHGLLDKPHRLYFPINLKAEGGVVLTERRMTSPAESGNKKREFPATHQYKKLISVNSANNLDALRQAQHER